MPEVMELPKVKLRSRKGQRREVYVSAKPAVRQSLGWKASFIGGDHALKLSQLGSVCFNLSELLDAGKIFTVVYENHVYCPRAQFKNGNPIPCIEDILRAFDGDGWQTAFFLSTPNGYLDGGLPMNILESNPSRAIDLAQLAAAPARDF